MTKIFWIIFILIQFFTTASAGFDDLCFMDALPYFKNLEKLSGSADDKNLMLSAGCKELSIPEMNDSTSIGEKVVSTLFRHVLSPFVGGLAVAAFDKLNGSQKQREFQFQLDRIKQIPNPMDRIRETYELVVKNQGVFDRKTTGSKLVTPSNLLNSAEKYGSAGVCREFASLLQWSLMQVARHPSSKDAALGPNDFSSELTGGEVPSRRSRKDSVGHAWVRIHLPQYQGKRLTGFNEFDLDTTYYPEKFSPLMPRRSGLSDENRRKALDQCSKIRTCLTKRALADLDQISRPSVDKEYRPSNSNSSSSGAQR